MMSCLLVLLCVGIAEPKPAWPDAFPKLPNYGRTFKAPEVNKDRTVYSQTAEYGWMGNDFRSGTATLARDPAFKQAHSEEALKKLGATPVKVGKRDAWAMPGRKDGQVQYTKIIVPLGEDKALIVEAVGAAHKKFPEELAAAFDAEKCAAALKSPPAAEGDPE
jgi:hypothetical protein